MKRVPFALLMLLLTGCAASSAQLHVSSVDRQRNYLQTFPRAFSAETRAGSGEYDAVLLVDGSPRGASNSGPINATSTLPMRQVLHVRVFWQPLKGSKPDVPTATNASLTWVIREAGDSPDVDELVYQGAGFVVVHPDSDGIHFSIRSSTLTLTSKQGDLPDPLGKANVRGDFYAGRNAAQVQTAIEQTQAAPRL